MVTEILVGENVKFSVDKDIRVRVVPESVIKDLSTDKNSQQVLAVVKYSDQYLNREIPLEPGNGVLVLEDVQDPGNVGTLIRSAVAFGFEGVLLNEKCADPFSPKAVHASAGSVLSAWIVKTDDFYEKITAFKNKGYHIISTDLKGDSYSGFENIENLILAMGNEGNGISDKLRGLSDILFKIPMNSEAVESLNVGAAGAVSMYLSKRV